MDRKLYFGPIGICVRNDRVFTINYDSFAAVVSKTPLVINPSFFGTIFKTDMAKHFDAAIKEVKEAIKKRSGGGEKGEDGNT